MNCFHNEKNIKEIYFRRENEQVNVPGLQQVTCLQEGCGLIFLSVYPQLLSQWLVPRRHRWTHQTWLPRVEDGESEIH